MRGFFSRDQMKNMELNRDFSFTNGIPLLKTFGELMNWGMGKKISEIPHQTLVIASDMDYTPVEYKKSYTDKMQHAKLVVIENSRHGVVLDQAEKLNEELLKFL